MPLWLSLAFCSAFLLGLYDVSKKEALRNNAVIPVLFLNTLFSTIIFLPFLIDCIGGFGWFGSGLFDITSAREALENPAQAHLFILGKATLVLSSWISGYFGLKHLPITIVGPINATRPVLVLLGAMIFFGERLNLWQWAGVLLAIVSVFLLSRSSKKESIDFAHNRWILCLCISVLLGAASGLYDKFIMKRYEPIFVQTWYNLYQCIIMGTLMMVMWYPKRDSTTPFHWSWAIPAISVLISAADFVYYTALAQPGSMISIISLVRRGAVIVSFLCGWLIFKEKNLKAKALDLGLIILGMIFIYIGSMGA